MGHTRPVTRSQFRRIALIRALQLGDLLCVTPALRALRSAYPHAEITLIGLPWSRELRRRLPAYIDDVLEFPGWPGIPEREFDRAAYDCFERDARLRYFDLVLQAHGDGSVMNGFAWSIPARMHAGFAPETAAAERAPANAQLVPYPGHLPEPLRLLQLIEHLGISSRGTELEFPLTEDDRDDADELLASFGIDGEPFACVHPGARAGTRRWSAAHFGAVADAIAARGLPVLVTGTEDEREITAEVLGSACTPVIDVTGRTTLGSLGALLERARLLVANDTGVSHIASALGTRSVIVFTGSERARWAPLDDERHIAVGSGSGDAGVDAEHGAPAVDEVLAAVNRQLGLPR